MKKVLNKIGDSFGEIFGCVVAVLVLISLVVIVPLDYIKYKRSFYYKIEHKKYEILAGWGIHFELYNEIIKNHLPIKYIFNPNDDSLECGWFVFDNTLIIPNIFSFEYDTESGEWKYCDEDIYDDENEKRSIMKLDECIETEIQEANELAGKIICNKAVVLIDVNSVDNVELAKKESNFLIYDDNRVEVLENFCKNNKQ